MSKRTVFGRLRFLDNGVDYKIEMRADGLYIRMRHSKKEWHIMFAWLLKFCKHQLEIFDEPLGTGNQGASMPNLQKTIVVPDWGNAGAVHENPQQPKQDPQGRVDGLASLAGRADTSSATDSTGKAPSQSGLQGTPGEVVEDNKGCLPPKTG